VLLLYVGGVNLVVGTFNLVPGFPLDGGRLLRAALWAWRRDLAWATRVASYAGSSFGFALVAFGLLRLLGGEVIGGLWLVLIGMFLQQAAGASYGQMVARRSLEGVPVHEAMARDVITVPDGITLAELVDGYFWPHHVTSFPVVSGAGPTARPVGVVTIGHVKGVPRARWGATAVREVMAPLRDDLTIEPSASCWEALSRVTGNGVGRLAVLQSGRLVGYLSVRDLMHVLALGGAAREGAAGHRGRPPAVSPGPTGRAA
jgi:CBS domain-containing protein